MNTSFTTCDDVGRLQRHQALEPQTRRLRLAMAELPRLNDLVGLANAGTDDADRVLNSDPVNRRVHKGTDEIKSRLLPAISNLGREVPSARHGQMRAGRMGDHHVPALRQQRPVKDAVLNMEGRTIFRRQQVAGPCFVPKVAERATDNAGKLTCDEHPELPHASNHRMVAAKARIGTQAMRARMVMRRARFIMRPHV